MHDQLEQKPLEKNVAWIIVGLIIFVVAISAFVFSKQSLRLDEAQSLWQTSHSPTRILSIIAQDVHVPFYHFILHYWQVFLGNTVQAGRILSLIFFIVSIPAMYFLGKRVLNQSAGIFAAVLLGISPFMNWYGNEIRMYSLFTLFGILNQYFFIGIYKKQGRDSWFGYFVVSLLGLFTHYFFLFILLVQVIFYFMYRGLFPHKTLRKFILIAAIFGLIFCPWLLYVHSLGTANLEAPVLSAPTSVNVFNTLSEFLFGFQNDHLNTILVSLWPLTVLLGFLALRENKKVSPDIIYLLMSILIPIAAAFIVSITVRPLFVSRYLIITIPPLYLFIGWIFSTYPKPLSRMLKVVLIFAMLAGLTVEAISSTNPIRENYREATEYLQKNASPQDIIALSAPFTVYPVEYYYRGSTEIQTLPIWNRIDGIPAFSDSELPKDVNILKGQHEKIWVLLSYDQGYEKKIKDYFDNNYQRIETKNFSLGLNLYVYRFRYDTHLIK
jgi:mannosyltransferase